MADPSTSVRRSSSRNRTLDPLTPGKSNTSPENSPLPERQKKSSRGKARDVQNVDSVVFKDSDLKRIQSLSHVPTKTEEESMRSTTEEKKLQSMLEAKARKERLLAYDDEKRRNHPLSEAEAREVDRANYILRHANEVAKEQKDDVKFMNSIAQYAKCATIRDLQIEEKKAITRDRVEEERRLNAMMELERIKAIQMYEERETKKAQERVKGAEVIKKQIEEREKERILQQEAREQELIALQLQKQKLEEEEREDARRKAVAQKSMITEITKSNTEQIMRKHMQVEREKEEDLRIAQYISEKAQREQQLVEEQERKRAEKEKEVARMRSLQEKKKDEQEEKDALRAKRAMEARDREWRQKELEKAEQKERVNRELAVAREHQKIEREMKMALVVQEERVEYEKNVSIAMRQMEEETKRDQSEKARRLKHSEEIRDQVRGKEEMKKRELQEFFDEGRRLRVQQQEEMARLEEIKVEKLRQLRNSGIPDKFLSDLERRKIVL